MMNHKTTEEIMALDRQNHMGAYGRFPAALTSGKGAAAFDPEGKRYIDFGSGIGVNSLGYADEGWVQAVSGQAARIQHTSNLYYNQPQAELSEMLCGLTDYSKAFLCNSGAEANECAIKLARKYSFEHYGEGRNQIITLRNSFHGRTVTTLSATGQDSMHDFFFPFTGGFAYAEAGSLEELKGLAGKSTCAVMMELIQGEGGVRPLEAEYVREAAALCKEQDILLIVDEVQTGIGRTGRLFAYEHYSIRPDIVTAAKGLGGGLPIGACLCNEKLSEVIGPGQHGTTFGGNPVVCAGALYVLGRVTAPGFLEEVEEKGEYLRSRVAALPQVREVRGRGMMLGAVLEEGEAKTIAARCVENGLLILTAKTLLRMLPPLTITKAEIDEGLGILSRVLDTTK